MADPTFVSNTQDNWDAFETATSHSTAYTVSGTNPYLHVHITMVAGQADLITGITGNGAVLTKVADQVDKTNSVWELKAPTTGNLVISYPAWTLGKIWINIRLYNGVHQTTPSHDVTLATAGTGNPTVTVPSVVGDLVVDGGYSWGVSSETAGAGQTARYSMYDPFANSSKTFGSDELASGTSTVMSWTAPGTSGWDTIGLALTPAPAGGGIPTLVGPRFSLAGPQGLAG